MLNELWINFEIVQLILTKKLKNITANQNEQNICVKKTKPYCYISSKNSFIFK